MEKVTMIINHRDSSPDRTLNVNTIIDYYKPCIDEIIVVEQDSVQKLSVDTKHFFVKNDGLFNHSWGYNVGLQHSSNSKIIFNDNDIILDMSDLITSLEQLDYYDTVNPYSLIIDLDQAESIDFASSKQLPVKREGREGVNYASGMLLANKDKFISIGAWDEDVRGWGGEDDLMTYKIFNMLSHKEMNYDAYHLYHSRFITDTHKHEHYLKNLKVLTNIRSMNREQLFEYYNNRSIGNTNKYN